MNGAFRSAAALTGKAAYAPSAGIPGTEMVVSMEPGNKTGGIGGGNRIVAS